MIIGKFTTQKERIIGKLDALLGSGKLIFTPSSRGPDYLVTADSSGCEVGAAWKRTSKDGKSYLSVRLDSPFLPGPVNCALFTQADGSQVGVRVAGEQKT